MRASAPTMGPLVPVPVLLPLLLLLLLLLEFVLDVDVDALLLLDVLALPEVFCMVSMRTTALDVFMC